MSKSKFDRNYARRKLELVLRDLNDYTADEFWREISRIASGATGLPSAEQLQAHAKELEAINLGLTKTLVEMEAEKARLVGALGKIDAMPHYDYPLRYGCNKSLHDRYELMLQTASEALAAHRKQEARHITPTNPRHGRY